VPRRLPAWWWWWPGLTNPFPEAKGLTMLESFWAQSVGYDRA
jgi:hypothetical protein